MRRETKSMKNKLKVGIVGAPRGQSFIRSFQAIEETDVIAICDLNIDVVEGVASQFNIDQKYTEFEEMVQSDLDIVVVSTPMPLHAPQSTLALQEGKHVISEVPAATDLQQCWELAKSVENSKKKYMMAENYVYTKPNILIRELAMQGLFGDIYFGEGQYIHELKSLNEITKWRRKWQTGRNGCTYSTHSLGPVLQWFEDRVCTVSCFGSGHHYEDSEGKQYENEDTISMICKTTRGGLVEIRVDMLSDRPALGQYYSLQGTKGCYEAARGLGDQPKIWLAEHSDQIAWQSLSDFEEQYMPEIWRNPSMEALQAGHGGGDYLEVREFVDSIINDTKSPIDIYESLDMTVPGLVSEVSINRESIPVEVPDFRSIKRFPEDLPSILRDSEIVSWN
ncbi:TPA: Gfo/Idh/MocA family oxidoreductase [Candidatus Poribacteria bacterium]|nr:Gfo/Idh/MocA family oxidoreductase [Candidatus Poribacteria bacterium]